MDDIENTNNAKNFAEYRTISLIGHTVELFLRINHKGISQKLEEGFKNTQMEFRKS